MDSLSSFDRLTDLVDYQSSLKLHKDNKAGINSILCSESTHPF